jgi:3-oxoacyl-[acyl-carrier protein] reductase
MNRLQGKVAVVTGGSRGIGRCIVETFLRHGAEHVYSVDMTEGDYAMDRLTHLALSVTDRAGIDALCGRIKAERGRLDILINNAGITRDALLAKMEESAWDQVIDVNLKGVFNMTQGLLPLMTERSQGSVVNISSVVGEYGNIGQSNYAASKAGMIGMTYTWAKEFNRKGGAIRVNAIAPGYVETEMVLSVPEKILDPLRQKTPLGRLGKPQEIADAALFLASDESTYVNGHVLAVNGGLRL